MVLSSQNYSSTKAKKNNSCRRFTITVCPISPIKCMATLSRIEKFQPEEGRCRLIRETAIEVDGSTFDEVFSYLEKEY